jgi:gluconolactonase
MAESPIPEEADVQKVSGDCQFTEGPAADAEGSLFFSDSPNNRIMALRPNGKTEIWKVPSGRANGMNFDPEGRLVTCCAQGAGGAQEVQRYEPDGSVTVLASHYDGKRLNSPNDLCFDSQGRIYFTDPRYGSKDGVEQDAMAVYRIEEDGSVTRVIEDVDVPNGILIAPDDKVIYLVDNDPEDYGARTLLMFHLDDEGNWDREAEIYDFAPDPGGDGMVLDVEGNIYLTAGSGEKGGVYIFTKHGEQVAFIDTPENPANCTFGGKDLTTLYITAGTSVYKVEGTVPGQLAYPKA